MKFRKAVRYGPIFTCTVCEQDMFISNVNVLDEEFEANLKEESKELYERTLRNKHFISVNLLGAPKAYMCGTCKKYLNNRKIPPMAVANGLAIVPLGKDSDLNLTELESNMISRRIMFQKIYQLPKSRMAACKDHLINIPIASEDVLNTLQNLPRTPQEAGLLEVKLKRKLNIKILILKLILTQKEFTRH